jgi:hypothetical protein
MMVVILPILPPPHQMTCAKATDSVLGTVITSFPDTWNSGEPYSLISAVQNELINKQRPFIKSAEDVAHMVLRKSIDFFSREGPLNSKIQECFLSSINDIVSLFNQFV